MLWNAGLGFQKIFGNFKSCRKFLELQAIVHVSYLINFIFSNPTLLLTTKDNDRRVGLLSRFGLMTIMPGLMFPLNCNCRKHIKVTDVIEY